MKYKWSIILFVFTKDDYLREDSNFFVEGLFDTLKNQHKKVDILLVRNYFEQFEGKVRLNTSLFRLKKKPRRKNTIGVFLENYGSLNLGEDTDFKKILTDIKKLSPSEKYLLYTWGHGSGFLLGGEKSSDNRKNFAISKYERHKKIKQEPDLVIYLTNDISFTFPGYKYSNLPEAKWEPLSPQKKIQKEEVAIATLLVGELRKAISSVFKKKKIDLLIMMNCFMQNMDSAYELKNCIDILLAPETVIHTMGYNNDIIFARINENPDISNKDVAKTAIDSFEKRYQLEGHEKLKEMTISVVKLNSIGKLSTIIDKIAKRLLLKVPNKFNIIKRCRDSCEDLTKKYLTGKEQLFFIDFIYFSSLLKKNKIISHTLFDELIDHSDKYILYKWPAHTFFGNEVLRTNGFSIYFPNDKNKLGSHHDQFYRNGPGETNFSRNALWNEFINAYLEK